MNASISFVGVWTTLVAVGVYIYVLLDGFDLGIGVLYGLSANPDHRDLMMRSIAPVWDGNETWLVFCGLALLSAFPIAFSIIIPAIYFPVLIMLLSLIFRGVAFEYRFTDRFRRRFWDGAFHYGSIVATFAQGMILGAFIQGFQTDGRHYTGRSWDFVTLFTILTGFALIGGYTLLGAGWLIIKTEGELQAWSRRMGRGALICVVAGIILVSIWTPLIEPQIYQRWFSWPNMAWLAPVPIATAAVAFWAWRSLALGKGSSPMIAGALLFLLAYVGIGISLWPTIVPYSVTLWQAASSPSTQAFLLVGALFLLPVILMYTGWSYWVFRGKVRSDIGYGSGA
jgi:cytochrome d ubiquinol oxidase subunit II